MMRKAKYWMASACAGVALWANKAGKMLALFLLAFVAAFAPAATAADTPITPVELGIDYGGTVTAVGTTFATIIVAAIGLMIAVVIVRAFVRWVRSALAG